MALREEAQRRGLSISEYGVTVVETGEVHRFADEDDLYRFLGYEPIPPELRESCGELAGGAQRQPAGARRGRRPGGRAPLPLRLVLGRQGLDRGDGANRKVERIPLPRAHRPLALPSRGPHGGAVAGDRRGQRTRQAVQGAPGRRGEHPRGRGDRRRRRAARRARLGRCLAPPRLRQEPDRADPRCDRPPSRRLHRAPHRPQAQSPRRGRRRHRAGRRRGPSRRRRRSRSTASPTGSTCATSTRGLRARPACASR